MEIQVATLCDAAADYAGKLTVMGAFDTLCGMNTPIVHRRCSLAIRICFRPEDEGLQQLRVAIIDGEGRAIIKPFEPSIGVRMPSKDAFFVTHNLVIDLRSLTFEKAGPHAIDISAGDAVLARVPLRIMLVDENGKPLKEGAAAAAG